MERAIELAAIAGTVALATWAHYRFWTWRYRVEPGEDETVFAETGDGWSLALARRRPRGAPRPVPVLLLHGIAANHACMDFAVGRLSLAAHLASAGLDCFALDLRGHGRSRRGAGARGGWGFDEYLERDVPAALDAIRRATGAERVAIVGHSQGALLGMAACALHADRVAALVALAGPAWFERRRAVPFLARFAVLVVARLNRFLARSLAPFSGYWHPAVSEVIWNANNVDPPVLRRAMVNVVENVSPGVLRQFGHWIRTDTWRSRDESVDYRALLPRCRQPALFVAAKDDRLAPPSVVRRAHDDWGGAERALWVAGRDGGCGCEYGHSDLLFGRSAPDEVFPRIRDWLLARPELAARAPTRAPLAAPGPRA